MCPAIPWSASWYSRSATSENCFRPSGQASNLRKDSSSLSAILMPILSLLDILPPSLELPYFSTRRDSSCYRSKADFDTSETNSQQLMAANQPLREPYAAQKCSSSMSLSRPCLEGKLSAGKPLLLLRHQNSEALITRI